MPNLVTPQEITVYRRICNTIIFAEGDPHGKKHPEWHQFQPYWPGKYRRVEVNGVGFRLEWRDDIEATGTPE